MTGKLVFMVADGDRKVCESIAELLQNEFKGAVVYTATDGHEALKKLQHVPASLFISGLELAGKLRFRDLLRSIELDPELAKLPIAVLSDISDPSPPFEGENLGARIKFLSRPFEKDELLATVKGMLQVANGEGNLFHTLTLRAGTSLFLEGQKADSAFLLKKGCLKVTLQRSGQLVELGLVVPGEFVGEMAHITGDPRSADVHATEECELIVIPCGTLDMLLFSRPTWTKALLKTLCRRLREANRERSGNQLASSGDAKAGR